MVESQPPLPVEETPPLVTASAPSGQQWRYEDIAKLKQVAKQTVMEWVKRGMIPSPVYTGANARFTDEMVATIMTGTSAPGTFPVTLSPRAQWAREARERKEKEAKRAARKKATKSKSKPKAKAKSTALHNKSEKSKPTKSKQRKGARS